MDSKIPWEQLSLDTLKSLCQDLGLNKPQASRTDLIAYIKDISKNGVKPVEPADNDKEWRENAVKQFMEQHRQQEMECREEEEKEHEALIKRTTDFWNGNVPVNPTLERFDTLSSLSIGIRHDVWGGGEDEDSWLKVYQASIKSQSGQKLGKFTYRVVNLPELRRQIGYYNMHTLFDVSERGGQELEALGQSMFNKQGNPNPQFYAGGNGVFGPELAQKSFALLSGDESGEGFFFVEEDYRRRGVGTQALKQLFKHKSLQNVETLFVWPSVNEFPSALRGTPVEEKAFKAIVKFFTKAGFRHIGSGPTMAYILHDERHPSRLLAAEKDTTIPYKPAPTLASFFANLN